MLRRNRNIIELIKQSRNFFQKMDMLTLNHLKLFTHEINGKTYRVFGIEKDSQSKMNYASVRTTIAAMLGFSKPKKFSQIIGDSALFSQRGTQHARNVFKEFLANNTDDLLLYGFTGQVSQTGDAVDVNHLVSEWAEKNTEESNRIIANIVDEHTPMAIEQWGCTIPSSVHNFILVYTKEATPEAKFGDDCIVSDSLTNNRSLCFEGGIQSLNQAIFMMKNNIQMECVLNLRDLNNSRHFDSSANRPYLSASHFLFTLKNFISHAKKAIKQADIKTFVENYLQKYSLYNTKSKDAGTKEGLWKLAMEQFYGAEVWKKLGLVTFNNPPELNRTYGGLFQQSTESSGESKSIQPETKITSKL